MSVNRPPPTPRLCLCLPPSLSLSLSLSHTHTYTHPLFSLPAISAPFLRGPGLQEARKAHSGNRCAAIRQRPREGQVRLAGSPPGRTRRKVPGPCPRPPARWRQGDEDARVPSRPRAVGAAAPDLDALPRPPRAGEGAATGSSLTPGPSAVTSVPRLCRAQSPGFLQPRKTSGGRRGPER